MVIGINVHFTLPSNVALTSGLFRKSQRNAEVPVSSTVVNRRGHGLNVSLESFFLAILGFERRT
jgi:hypothetical protein